MWPARGSSQRTAHLHHVLRLLRFGLDVCHLPHKIRDAASSIRKVLAGLYCCQRLLPHRRVQLLLQRLDLRLKPGRARVQACQRVFIWESPVNVLDRIKVWEVQLVLLLPKHLVTGQVEGGCIGTALAFRGVSQPTLPTASLSSCVPLPELPPLHPRAWSGIQEPPLQAMRTGGALHSPAPPQRASRLLSWCWLALPPRSCLRD